jgi:hypothetical protein
VKLIIDFRRVDRVRSSRDATEINDEFHSITLSLLQKYPYLL